MTDHAPSVTRAGPVPISEAFGRLRGDALQWDAIQQTRLRINNMFKAFDRLERPYPPGMAEVVVGELEKHERLQLKAVQVSMREGDEWMQHVHAFICQTSGLGPAVFCVLGLIPPIPQFPNPAKLWAYLGLAVVDGKAVKLPMPPPPNNPRGAPGMHFSRRIRAYATVRVVDPIIKHATSPYRLIYDARRMHTIVTHPEWAEERNKKGELTPAGHYYRDAIRYTAKRLWRDVWNVAHDDQPGPVTHCLTVAP